MRLGSARVWAGATLALLVAGASAWASSSAVVSGVVRDATGAVVAEAEVSLLTRRQTVVRTVRANHGGSFTLQGIAPGSYLLVAAAAGLR